MEHNKLSLEWDKELINKILEDSSMRYILLFLYITRNDLFRNLSDPKIVESHERVMGLDEVYKGNLLTFWEPWFLETAVDLGYIRNIRSLRELEQKEEDFVIKFCDPILIENDTIIVPDETLFLFITKKFKAVTRREFNLSLTRLKGIRCQSTGVIHAFLYETREGDFTLSDDMYDIFDEFGNVFQAIKIEHTIEGFFERFEEIQTKLDEYLEIYDPLLISRPVQKKISQALDENKEIFPYLKDEKIKLSDKFNHGENVKSEPVFMEWHDHLMKLIQKKYGMKKIEHRIEQMQGYYSGKKKKLDYLTFIEKVSYNEDNLIDKIQNDLIHLREQLIPINDYITSLTKKQIKLLNLDFERVLLTTN